MDDARLARIASRLVAADGPEGPESETVEHKAFIHMNVESGDTGWDPDGKYAAAFSAAVDKLGGTIDNWEDEWLEIIVPQSKLHDMVQALDKLSGDASQPDAQLVAQKYEITAIYGDDGEGNPGEEMDVDRVKSQVFDPENHSPKA